MLFNSVIPLRARTYNRETHLQVTGAITPSSKLSYFDLKCVHVCAFRLLT